MTQLGSDNALRRKFPIAIYDSAGGGIPGYALISLGAPKNNSFGKSRVFAATQPAGSSADRVFVSQPVAIVAAGGGFITNHYPARALYDGSGTSANDPVTTPAIDQEWGPLAGSWALRPSAAGGRGFKIVGGINTDNSTVEVVKIAAGATSGAPKVNFACVGNKATRHETVTVRILNDDFTTADGGSLTNEIGALTFYDPFNQFYSRTQNYVGSEHPFQGSAELHHDPAGIDPDRYEITGMDRFLTVIKGRLTKVSNYPAQGSTLKVEYLGAGNYGTPANPLDQFAPGWDRRFPAIKGATDGSQFTGYYADNEAGIIFDATGIAEPGFGFNQTSAWPFIGLFIIGDPETVPPNYRILQMQTKRQGTVYNKIPKNYATGGLVQLFQDGTRTNDGGTIAVVNPWNIDAPSGADVKVDFAFSPPRADEFTCGA